MSEQSEIHKAWVALKGDIKKLVNYSDRINKNGVLLHKKASTSGFLPMPSGYYFQEGKFMNMSKSFTLVCTIKEFTDYCEMMKEKRIDIIGQNGNDGLHYDSTTQQFESLSTDSKPVFTQAMYESGDVPEVGSKVTLFKKTHSKRIDEFLNEELTVIGVTKGLDGQHVITWEHEHLGLCCGVYLTEFFKPIQSPREKFIAEFINLIHYCDENEIIADDVYKAGYRKLTPEQIKEYGL